MTTSVLKTILDVISLFTYSSCPRVYYLTIDIAFEIIKTIIHCFLHHIYIYNTSKLYNRNKIEWGEKETKLNDVFLLTSVLEKKAN